MSEARFALHALADPHVGLQWFEAVAVALGMAETWPEGARSVPPFEAYTISADGAIRPLPGVKASAPPANQLGVALQALLADPAAPQALREAAAGAAQAPPGAPFAPYVQALAYFERPDRARLLLFLAQRVVPELPEVDPQEELRRLEQRARERAESHKPPGAGARVSASLGRQWRRWRPALPAALLVAAVVAVSWAAYRHPEARAKVTGPLRQAVAWLRPATPPEAPPAEAPAEESPRAATSTAKRAESAPADVAAQPEGAATGDRASLSPGTSTPPHGGRQPDEAPGEEPALPPIRAFEMETAAVPASSAAEAEAGVVIEGLGRVYREGDAGVEPARIGRRYLPADNPQDVPPGRTGVFELVVDEKGQVERVRLLSADNRYQERMLLSAAKAWRFEPARRNGVPVKFLTQVKVTW